jgi:transposase InsO family protein
MMGKKSKKTGRKKTGSPPGGARRGGGHRGYYPFELKLKAVKLYLEEGYGPKVIAEELGIGRCTINDWARRYKQEGPEGLRSRCPGARRPQVSSSVKEKAVEIKKANPEYGSRRISHMLRRLFLGASHETVRQTLKEEGLVTPAKRKPVKNPARPRFFERATPNQLWQSDIFTFRLGGKNAYLIGYIDDYSRHIVGMGLYRSQTAAQVIEVYRKAIGEYGVPKEMLTDNGRQYTTWRGTTRFEAELKKERVKHIKSQPHHPMTLGKIERFWKTIFGEFLSRAQFDTFEEAQDRLALWIKYYNHKRPHQGIGGLCPADRFFEIRTELKKVLARGVEENVLEAALRGKPQEPFYMVGRMGEQSVVIRAEKGKVRMMVDEQEMTGTKELVYDLKEQPDGTEDGCGQSKEDASTELQRTGESAGSPECVEREKEALGGVQGVGDSLGEPEAVADQGNGSDDQRIGTTESGAGAERTSAGDEPGEAAGEDLGEVDRNETEQTAGEGAGNERRLAAIPSDGVILLTREEAPKVLELLRQYTAQRERAFNGRGEPCEEAGGDDPESAQRQDDRDAGSEGVGGEPQDILQVGGQSSLGDARGIERPPLRATVSASRWREDVDDEGDREYPEATLAGRGKGPDPYIHG